MRVYCILDDFGSLIAIYHHRRKALARIFRLRKRDERAGNLVQIYSLLIRSVL